MRSEFFLHAIPRLFFLLATLSLFLSVEARPKVYPQLKFIKRQFSNDSTPVVTPPNPSPTSVPVDVDDIIVDQGNAGPGEDEGSFVLNPTFEDPVVIATIPIPPLNFPPGSTVSLTGILNILEGEGTPARKTKRTPVFYRRQEEVCQFDISQGSKVIYSTPLNGDPGTKISFATDPFTDLTTPLSISQRCPTGAPLVNVELTNLEFVLVKTGGDGDGGSGGGDGGSGGGSGGGDGGGSGSGDGGGSDGGSDGGSGGGSDGGDDDVSGSGGDGDGDGGSGGGNGGAAPGATVTVTETGPTQTVTVPSGPQVTVDHTKTLDHTMVVDHTVTIDRTHTVTVTVGGGGGDVNEQGGDGGAGGGPPPTATVTVSVC